MFTKVLSLRFVPTVLLLSAALTAGVATSLLAQQAEVQSPAIAGVGIQAPASAPAVATPTPAPRSSVLFNDGIVQPALDAAPARSPNEGGTHVFRVTTLVLVLAVVILVLLID
jgi:hypothetical protein